MADVGADEGDGAENMVAGNQRHYHQRTDAECPQIPQIFLAAGHGDEHIVGDVRDHLARTRPYRRRQAERIVTVRRPTVFQPGCVLLLERVGMNDAEAPHGSVRPDHIDDAPRAEVRERHARYR